MSVAPAPSRSLRVLATGGPVYVQDAGRPGYAAMGVGRSGVADRRSAALAARAVGNPADLACLEVTLGGLELVVEATPGAVAWMCLTGASAAWRVGERACAPGDVVAVRAGERVRIGLPDAGLRCYLAVRGGIDVPRVLGSRSRDTLAGIGPEPLRPGDRVALGPAPGTPIVVDAVVPRRPATSPGEDGAPLRVVRGPRDASVREPDALVETAWRVAADSDRVGLRLEGDRAVRERLGAVAGCVRASEGVVRGAVQVPPSGSPVVFLADHPVTGGYPVVGVIVDEDVDRAAQLRPGESLRLRWAPAPR